MNSVIKDVESAKKIGVFYDVSDRKEKQREAIAQRIKQLRLDKGVGYQKFAIQCGFQPKHYWRIEEGEANMTLQTLLRVIESHDLTLEEFFKGM